MVQGSRSSQPLPHPSGTVVLVVVESVDPIVLVVEGPGSNVVLVVEIGSDDRVVDVSGRDGAVTVEVDEVVLGSGSVEELEDDVDVEVVLVGGDVDEEVVAVEREVDVSGRDGVVTVEVDEVVPGSGSVEEIEDDVDVELVLVGGDVDGVVDEEVVAVERDVDVSGRDGAVTVEVDEVVPGSGSVEELEDDVDVELVLVGGDVDEEVVAVEREVDVSERDGVVTVEVDEVVPGAGSVEELEDDVDVELVLVGGDVDEEVVAVEREVDVSGRDGVVTVEVDEVVPGAASVDELEDVDDELDDVEDELDDVDDVLVVVVPPSGGTLVVHSPFPLTPR
jgi:hypothetical protein